MRSWVRLAARFYPADWRRRYGAEFDTLVDDASPGLRDVFNVLGGAMKMQMSTVNWRVVTAVGGLLGLLIAAGWAFSLPNQYVSRASLRITPSQIPEGIAPADYNQQMAGRINQIVQAALTRHSLAEIIQRPDLNLYKNDRTRQPLEDVIERMKAKDIRIDILAAKPGRGGFASAFVVSFTNPDPAVAQRTTNALVTNFADANFKLNSRPDGASLDVLDPASLPRNPTSPNRWQITLLGLALGVGAGILVVGIRRWPMVALSGLVACILAGAASFLVPDTFVSHAVLVSSSPEKLAGLIRRVSSDDFLKGVIEKENLYPGSRPEALDKMKRELTFEILPNQRSNAVAISFRYSDRVQAQRVVRQVTDALVAANQVDRFTRLDLLDPPSLGANPVAPNRLSLAGMGLGIGLLCAVIASFVRRRVWAT